MELNLTLDFACCGCSEPVTVTVQCSGKGLTNSCEGTLVTVKVPCPSCGQINELCFEPNGQVRSVRPCLCIPLVPEPSLN